MRERANEELLPRIAEKHGQVFADTLKHGL
jgi:hypothetical protein